MRAQTLIGAALLLSMSSLAPAQTPSPAPLGALREIKDTTRLVQPWNLTVDQIEDRDIHGPNGERIAEVDEVLEDEKGEVRAVVAEFGGFYGIGDTEVIVTLDQLTADGARFTTTLTQDDLRKLPPWSD